jgi:hypothetical protein
MLAVEAGYRMLPVLRIPASDGRRVAKHAAPGDRKAGSRRADPRAVTGLWNATEELRRAYEDAQPDSTITLKSPGPFLMDAIDITKPITLRGADDVRPLFLGGPGCGLRIAASQVRLENLHFLQVGQPLAGQRRHDSRAMIECSGSRLTLDGCSFQDTSRESDLATAVSWRPPADTHHGVAPAVLAGRGRSSDVHAAEYSSQPAGFEGRNLLFRKVGVGVDVNGMAAVRLRLENCVHLGPGPLVSSASLPGRPFEAIELSVLSVTVFGASTITHAFGHPIDDMLPLSVVAENSLLVPQVREQPILAVRYAAPTATLMPKVSWSGSGSICPADATVLELTRSPDTAPVRLTDIAAWKAYWGPRQTGLVGLRLECPDTVLSNPTQVPRLRADGQTAAGAELSQLRYPPAVTLEQLPILLMRLTAE